MATPVSRSTALGKGSRQPSPNGTRELNPNDSPDARHRGGRSATISAVVSNLRSINFETRSRPDRRGGNSPFTGTDGLLRTVIRCNEVIIVQKFSCRLVIQSLGRLHDARRLRCGTAHKLALL